MIVVVVNLGGLRGAPRSQRLFDACVACEGNHSFVLLDHRQDDSVAILEGKHHLADGYEPAVCKRTRSLVPETQLFRDFCRNGVEHDDEFLWLVSGHAQIRSETALDDLTIEFGIIRETYPAVCVLGAWTVPPVSRMLYPMSDGATLVEPVSAAAHYASTAVYARTHTLAHVVSRVRPGADLPTSLFFGRRLQPYMGSPTSIISTDLDDACAGIVHGTDLEPTP